MFHIVKLEEDLRKVFAVRAIVFCEEQLVPYDIELDEYDNDAIHILGELDGEPIASGRIRFVGEYAKLERLAIRKLYRGRGYGNLLLKYLLDVASEQGFSKFKLHAQVASQKFYMLNGFQPEGEVFFEANIPHCIMLKHNP